MLSADYLFRLQVGILMSDIWDAGTILQGVQVVVPYNHGAGITRVQVFEQFAHGSLLFLSSRVGGLTADVVPALVADTYRVGVVVLAVSLNSVMPVDYIHFPDTDQGQTLR